MSATSLPGSQFHTTVKAVCCRWWLNDSSISSSDVKKAVQYNSEWCWKPLWLWCQWSNIIQHFHSKPSTHLRQLSHKLCHIPLQYTAPLTI